MRRIIGLSLLALSLIALCLQAASWQYHRYEIRHSKNKVILANINLTTTEKSLSQSVIEPTKIAWKKIVLVGRFDPDTEILVRNRYHEGTYGYGVVTLFTSESGKRYWIDRGWVQAGKDAKTAPQTQKVTSEQVSIIARVRIENVERQLGGTLFALPASSGTATLAKWNGSTSITTEPVYFDLISAIPTTYTPQVPTGLPTISDGPHLAYTFQWILFALLVAFAWFLVLREERRNRKKGEGQPAKV